MSNTNKGRAMNKLEALKKAVGLFETQSEFARILAARSKNVKLGASHVCQWLKRGSLPSRYALHVEAITRDAGDKVTAELLCPEMFKGRVRK